MLQAKKPANLLTSSMRCSSSEGNARSSSYKRSRRKSLSSKSHSSTSRKFLKKHNGKEHASCERGKKRRKLHSNAQPNTKLDRKKRRLKKRKPDMEIEGAKKNSSSKERKIREVQNDVKAAEKSNNLLEVAMTAQEQQKALIRHNAEIAKARLESGELQRARDEQRKMHQLYGTVDWRANKKLRTEKKILERSVAAGKRLASLEQREYARMDAFRVALGLPTAEAQRQAEWRREATQALAETHRTNATPLKRREWWSLYPGPCSQGIFNYFDYATRKTGMRTAMT
ncbi:hypothetical protein GOP47_0008107 [Adiantum capillus-veneris]|uniref:Uncharacterized protein n=1 Tax=Adiantum capillus-veneris TaxID=13818 RepID=A0A9D4ZJC9_ADICA|nr:hypothetical protein GOP47_0008107 [Adiantum capillus-veneris]